MRASSVAALIVVGACANADGGGANYAELAQLVGISLVTPGGGGEAGALADATQLVQGTLPAGFHDEDGFAVGQHLAVRHVYLAMCETSRGARVACGPSAQDPAAPQSANVLGSWSGALELPGLAATVRRQGLWTWTGLETGAAQVTGTSTITHDAMLGDAHYRLSGDVDHQLVVRLQDGAILTGTQTAQLTGTRDGEAFAATAEVTIGGGVAQVMFDGSEPFEIDLATGPVLQRRE